MRSDRSTVWFALYAAIDAAIFESFFTAHISSNNATFISTLLPSIESAIIDAVVLSLSTAYFISHLSTLLSTFYSAVDPTLKSSIESTVF